MPDARCLPRASWLNRRFFLNMSKGQPNRASIGTTVTAIGAILLTCAIAVLVYGLFTAH
jgi:hypothetical protein